METKKAAIVVVAGGAVILAGLMAVINAPSNPNGTVVLALQPLEKSVAVGSELLVELRAESVAPSSQAVAAMSVALQWDAAVLRLVGVLDVSPPVWLESGFRPDPEGFNDSLLDGDAIYSGLAPLGRPVPIGTNSEAVVTLRFQALEPTSYSVIEIVEQLGEYGRTVVYDGTVPNLDVLAAFVSTAVEVVASCARADLDNDGDVDLADFAILQTCFMGPK